MLGCITLTPAWAAALACSKLHTCTENSLGASAGWLTTRRQVMPLPAVPDHQAEASLALRRLCLHQGKSYKMARSFQSHTVRYSQAAHDNVRYALGHHANSSKKDSGSTPTQLTLNVG